MITLGLWLATSLANVALGWFARDLVDMWSAWRARRYVYANTLGELPQRTPFASFAGNPPPSVVDWLGEYPGRPQPPTATPAPARHGAQSGYWDSDTQLMPLADTPTGTFNLLVGAAWTPTEALDLDTESWTCFSCRLHRHRDCPGCACPCTVESYLEVAT